GSSPDSVNASVWHSAVWVILTSTSPLRGGSTSSSTIFSGSPAAKATAAWDFMSWLLLGGRRWYPARPVPGGPASGHRFGFAQFADARQQRDELAVVQFGQFHAPGLPVLARLVDAFLRRGYEVPVDVARPHRVAAQGHDHGVDRRGDGGVLAAGEDGHVAGGDALAVDLDLAMDDVHRTLGILGGQRHARAGAKLPVHVELRRIDGDRRLHAAQAAGDEAPA